MQCVFAIVAIVIIIVTIVIIRIHLRSLTALGLSRVRRALASTAVAASVASVMPVFVQTTGLYWHLSSNKFLCINMELETCRRAAGIFHYGVWSGWQGEWCRDVENNADVVHVSVHSKRLNWDFDFDGRMSLGTAKAHYFRKMTPELEDRVLSSYTLQEIIVKDRLAEWIFVEPRSPDATPTTTPLPGPSFPSAVDAVGDLPTDGNDEKMTDGTDEGGETM